MSHQNPDSDLVPLTLLVNGRLIETEVEAFTTLLVLLREHLGLNGTKVGCGHGQCGACTVLVDGRRALSCLTIAAAAGGKAVTTIEGLAHGDQLHPMQEAFLHCEAFQCGYCTPGQILSAVSVIAEGHAHTPEEVAEAMSGNLCRCGAYEHIIEAVTTVLETGNSA